MKASLIPLTPRARVNRIFDAEMRARIVNLTKTPEIQVVFVRQVQKLPKVNGVGNLCRAN